MSSIETAGPFTCLVAEGDPRPPEPATWWRAVDGSGWLGYSGGPVSDPRWVSLQPLVDLPGASAGTAAGYHYVVETDIPPEAEADFNAWYETEHLPGLARVSGTVRARRYRRTSGQPLYIACYDLVAPDVLGSEAWQAVRNTAWSARVRPLFRNTRRTMHVLSSSN
jgi:hypothetical protein